MKSLILVLSLFAAAAAHAGPAESVSATVGQLLQVLQNSDNGARARGLCSLARAKVDSPTIAGDLLGRQYSSYPTDPNGPRQFVALVPSIIVSEFYNRLDGLGTQYSVSPNLIPKGSSRVGVSVNVGGTTLVVTVSKASHKVLDVQWRGISLVQNKKGEYQRALSSYAGNGDKTPVSSLVGNLINGGRLIRCN